MAYFEHVFYVHGTSRDDLQKALRNMGATPIKERPGSAQWEVVNIEVVTELGCDGPESAGRMTRSWDG